MIEILTRWEVALVAALVILNGAEAIGAGMARWRGLTKNVSRFALHTSMVLGALVYAWLTLDFAESLVRVQYGNLEARPISNWPYVVLLAMFGAGIGYGLIGHLRAIRDGLTRNVSRLATQMVMLILLVVMVGISELRWIVYLDRLEELGRTPAAAAETMQSAYGSWTKPASR